MTIATENYIISYRYIPGSLGTGRPIDNGAIMTTARRTKASTEKLLGDLKVDSRVQWFGWYKRGGLRHRRSPD